MPDWMSHLLISLIVAELFNIEKKSLVLLGALIPDLLSKVFLLYFYLDTFKDLSFSSFHTPLVCFILTILIAPLFKYDKVKTVFLINIGLITHFLSDLTMRHFTSGMNLFFPLSIKSYKLDLIWPEQSIYVLIASLVVFIIIKIIKKIDFSKLKI